MLQRPGLKLVVLVVAAAWFFGCGDDTVTSLGSRLRVPPDSLRVTVLSAVQTDSVYPIPVSLGLSPRAQLGRQGPYTAHVFYDFQVPTLKVTGTDTLRLDVAQIIIKTDSFPQAPFTGSMRLALREVAPSSRFWTQDSMVNRAFPKPAVEPDALAPDVVVVGAASANHVVTITFPVLLSRIAGYDSVRAAGGTLAVNVGVLLQSFDTPGQGFLEYLYAPLGKPLSAQFHGQANGDVADMTAVGAAHHRTFVDFDSLSYNPGTKLVVSDGYRLHSFLKFASVRTVLPDSALVYRAELLLTQVDTLTGRSFGDAQSFGVVVPNDTTPGAEFSKKQNELPVSFKSLLSVAPGVTSVIPVTPYVFDQQENHVSNRGLILKLTNEGTKVRHFEFYGAAAADSIGPRLRIYYGYPAQFEGGGR